MKRFQVGPARLDNGYEAEIYRTDANDTFPIHAGVRDAPNGPWEIVDFRADGRSRWGGYPRLLPNAVPVVSDAALDAYYAARGLDVKATTPRLGYDTQIAAGLAAAFAVMLAEQERGE